MLIWLDTKLSKSEIAKKLNLKQSEVMVENEDFAGIFLEKEEYDFDDNVSNLSTAEKLDIFKRALTDDDVDQMITDRIIDMAYERDAEQGA